MARSVLLRVSRRDAQRRVRALGGRVEYNANVIPVFYSFRRCPYAMRARLALDVSAQRCELREVFLKSKPEAMLRASPKGTVPVLVDIDGAVIDESLDIMLWALHRADPEAWLAPNEDSRAGMLALIRHFDDHFKNHLDRYKYPNRFDGADANVSRAAASADLQMLEQRLAETNFLFGERATLADMAIVPFVRQFANVDAAWFAEQRWPGVRRWLDAFVSSERFDRIMRPVDAWIPGTPGVPFPFS